MISKGLFVFAWKTNKQEKRNYKHQRGPRCNFWIGGPNALLPWTGRELGQQQWKILESYRSQQLHNI